MFTSSALPLPASFGHERHPFHLSSEVARPQPQGGCHFQHSPGQHQRCVCQTYQHNRSAPGNICDCGHSACYHSHNPNEGRLSPDLVVGALVEKIKKLEEIVIKERETRDSMITRERQTWERELRVLREALAPFYHSESEMRRKLNELEGRIEGTYDEHSRLRDKVLTVDDATTTLEKRVEDFELSQSRKRKVSHGHEGVCVMSPESVGSCSLSSASDGRSASTQRSPQPPSPMNPPLPISVGVAFCRPHVDTPTVSAEHYRAHSSYLSEQQPSNLHDEPRSSGFLQIDLAERLRGQHISRTVAQNQLFGTKHLPNTSHTSRIYKSSCGLPSPPRGRVSSGALPLSSLLQSGTSRSDLENRSAKKRKEQHGGVMALDVLAHVTAQSPLAH